MLQRLLRPAVLLRPALSAFAPRAAIPTFRALTTTSSSTTPPAAAAPTPAAVSTPEAAAAPAQSETLSLLPLLRSQPNHYITIHINGFPFLVTAGDKVTLPFIIKGVQAGDVLKLTHASILGSRDYTLKGNPYIDSSLFSCKARVVAETAEPMRVKEKTKRRQRRVKKVHSKHRYTVLMISELVVN